MTVLLLILFRINENTKAENIYLPGKNKYIPGKWYIDF
jgi:hypothetical protein